MAYKEMLEKIMNEQKLTNTEVVARCKEQGIEISETYFSRIKNNKKNPPSEEVSRAIANACNVDERLLVIEGYIDKSPKEIQEAFKTINFMAKSATAKLFKIIKKGDMKTLQEYLDTQPVSDTVIEILDSKEQYIEFLENNYTFESLGNGLALSMSLKEPVAINIEDDSMFPILQKGDKVGLEVLRTYNTNDILLIVYKKHKYIRYLHKENATVKLVPVNTKFKEIICDRKEIKILGRINNIIRKI